MLNFREVAHATENIGNETEILDMNFPKIWLYLAKLSSFLEIPENALPSCTGNLK